MITIELETKKRKAKGRHYSSPLDPPPKFHIWICDEHPIDLEYLIADDEEPICPRCLKEAGKEVKMTRKNPPKSKEIKPEQIEHLDRAEEIWEYICEQIDGWGVVNVTEMAEELGCNRHTARAALNRFEEQGLIWRRSRGPFGTEIKFLD